MHPVVHLCSNEHDPSTLLALVCTFIVAPSKMLMSNWHWCPWQLSSCWLVLLLALSVLLPMSIVAFTCWLCRHKDTMSSILTQVPVLLSCGFLSYSVDQSGSGWTRQQLEQLCSCKWIFPTLLVHTTCPQPTANIWAPLTCSLMSLMAWSRHNLSMNLDTTTCHFTVNSNDLASLYGVDEHPIAPPRL